MLARPDANNRITEEDQSRGNEMLPPPFALHISYKDHITNEIMCKKIQAAIGPYEDINNCEKKEVTMVRTCD